MGTQHVALRDRTFLLQNGLYVGCVSLVSGIANALATSPAGALPCLPSFRSNVLPVLRPRGHFHFRNQGCRLDCCHLRFSVLLRPYFPHLPGLPGDDPAPPHQHGCQLAACLSQRLRQPARL